jgi:hypothetical protein
VDSATGVPQATTLGLALRSSTTVGTEFSFVRFTFPAPPLLRPGKQYALVLTMIDAMVEEEGWNTQWRVSDPCPGGSLFLTFGSNAFTPLEGSAFYRTFVTA